MAACLTGLPRAWRGRCPRLVDTLWDRFLSRSSPRPRRGPSPARGVVCSDVDAVLRRRGSSSVGHRRHQLAATGGAHESRSHLGVPTAARLATDRRGAGVGVPVAGGGARCRRQLGLAFGPAAPWTNGQVGDRGRAGTDLLLGIGKTTGPSGHLAAPDPSALNSTSLTISDCPGSSHLHEIH
jgi:hypothetical protein